MRVRRRGRSVAGSVRSIVGGGWWELMEERVRFAVLCTRGRVCMSNAAWNRVVSLAGAELGAVVEVPTKTE